MSRYVAPWAYCLPPDTLDVSHCSEGHDLRSPRGTHGRAANRRWIHAPALEVPLSTV